MSSQKNLKKNNKSSTNINTPKREIKTIKNQSKRKSIIKRRTSDLTLSKASATAIASQVNHAKKEAINQWEKHAKDIMDNRDPSRKIPLRVWIFFWGSLLLFCISFYEAAIRPQLDVEIINNQVWIRNTDEAVVNQDNTNNWNSNSSQESDSMLSPNEALDLSTAPGVIKAFFYYLSNRDFDNTFNLMIPALQRSSEIREHFTAFRMIPFLDGIGWWTLTPSNFQYISTSTYWRDKYSFDLSYTLASNKEKYDETREFVVDTKWDSPKITNIVCTTPKCSYHPIFRPENFWLMR